MSLSPLSVQINVSGVCSTYRIFSALITNGVPFRRVTKIMGASIKMPPRQQNKHPVARASDSYRAVEPVPGPPALPICLSSPARVQQLRQQLIAGRDHT